MLKLFNKILHKCGTGVAASCYVGCVYDDFYDYKNGTIYAMVSSVFLTPSDLFNHRIYYTDKIVKVKNLVMNGFLFI